MKSAALLFVFAISLFVSAEANKKWEEYKAKHGKHYNDPAEDAKRKANFMANEQYINDHNSGKLGKFSFTVGHTSLSDWDPEEYKKKFGYKKKAEVKISSVQLDEDLIRVAPLSFDWRTQGAVTPIKDQGKCGCCWAFSVIGVLEGAYKIKYGQLLSLSEQQLVSCDTNNDGCNGGNQDTALNYVMEKGIALGSTYPYTSGSTEDRGQCMYNAGKLTQVKVTSIMKVANDESSLQQALATNGPISVAIDSRGNAFQLYESGIYSCQSPPQLDHAVLAVGYAPNYWIVKNSWNTTWGMGGYFYLAKGSSNSNANCGITQDAYYTVLA